MTLRPGTRLGRYEILTKLGAGGMGEVYRAMDTRLGRAVALKILPHEAASDRQLMGRFVREAQAASALNHPGIITVYEIDEAGGVHFIAAEFVEGVTLRAALEGGRMDHARAVEVAAQVASALAAAHAAGVIHRDVKPENVMLRPDGYVKVVDFGIAKLAGGARPGGEGAEALVKTGANVVIGTPLYMSPEQATARDVDARSDLWGVGVLLYEMLAGRRPFEADSLTKAFVLIIEHEPPPLTEHAPGASPELCRVVSKALAKRREERYQSAGEMLADLRRLKQQIERAETPVSAPGAGESDGTAHPSAGSEAESAGEHHTLSTVRDEAIPRVSADPHRTRGREEGPNNLPPEFTRLVGREQELAELSTLLRRGDVRLVTLTGIGGTGKTRLACGVARALLAEFSGGVFFVDLAPVNDPALVPSAIAQPLGVMEPRGGKPLVEALNESLRDKKMLLVLDNFEQVTGAAPIVKELLASAPGLKALVTSRVPLHLSAEQEFFVPPLDLPAAADQTSTPEGLMKSPAVALFVERARAVKATFTLDGENAAAVAEVCRGVDGLPLAIELAAARVKLMPPQAILARLGDRLKILAGGPRDLPARQQTMRAAISWSYDLLEPEEQRLLNRLSVFAGGCTLEAAEAVCGAGDGEGLDVLDGVSSLVDKSLLTLRDRPDGEPRFRLLEVVREYALERLREGGGAGEAQARHAAYFLSLAEQAERELVGPRQAGWFERLEDEHDNLRAALRWAGDHEAELYMRLASSLWRFWWARGHLTEGRGWLEQALALAGPPGSSPFRPKTLYAAANLVWPAGDSERARSLYEECLAAARAAGDTLLVAQTLNGLGTVAANQGENATASSYFEEMLGLGRTLGDKRLISVALNNLGTQAYHRDEFAAARELYEQALELDRQEGNQHGIIYRLANLGEITCQAGDFEASDRYFRECLASAAELANKRIIAACFEGFGALAAQRGNWGRSARLAGAAAALRASIGLHEPDERLQDLYVAEARAGLGEQEYARAESAGHELSLPDAIALASGEPPEGVNV